MNQMEKRFEVKANLEYVQNAISKYETYETCLKKNSKQLIEAMEQNDFCAIQQIFKECGVPDDQIKPLMKWGIDCWSQHYHMW